MVGWHHWLNGHGFWWTPGAGDRQGDLACCSSWGHKESDMTERLNWTKQFDHLLPHWTLISGLSMSRAFLFPSLHLFTQSSNSHQMLTIDLPAHSFSTCSSQNSHVTLQPPQPSVTPNRLVSLKRTFCLCNMYQNIMLIHSELGFPGGSTGKESACNPGNPGSIHGLGRSSAEGIGYPFPCSWASLVAQLVKESACNVGSIPGLGRSPGGGNSNPF